MVNVPVAAGTSGHLVGSTLASILLGPWRALLAIAAVLAVQALLFQDGGILAYGANLTDMGLVGCFVGYAVARSVVRGLPGPRGIAAGGVFGAFVATVAGAVCVSVWLSVSGLYPIGGILPVMLVTHVPMALLEAALTGGILVTLLRWRPDLVTGLDTLPSDRRIVVLASGLFIASLAVAAFVVPCGTALPDGLRKTAETLGFASRASGPWPWLAATAPSVMGVAGTAAAAAIAWGVGRKLATVTDDAHR